MGWHGSLREDFALPERPAAAAEPWQPELVSRRWERLRLALGDVLAYREASSRLRAGALDDMTREAEELGLYG